MSVSYTADAVIERRKTVTRRLGWRYLLPGDRLTLCRKVMGRRLNEPLERLAEVEVIDVRRERLILITEDDIEREAVSLAEFGGRTPTPGDWARWFAWTFGIRVNDEVTRIEWRYL